MVESAVEKRFEDCPSEKSE